MIYLVAWDHLTVDDLVENEADYFDDMEQAETFAADQARKHRRPCRVYKCVEMAYYDR